MRHNIILRRAINSYLQNDVAISKIAIVVLRVLAIHIFGFLFRPCVFVIC